MFQERANVSSKWAVSISSQSFALVGEYDSEDIGGNLREATGIEREVAFFARDPVRCVRKCFKENDKKKTLRHFKRP